MKKINLYTGLLLAILFSACQKEFLNRVPLTQPTEENFWQNKTDAEFALAGCYNFLSRGANAVSTTATAPGWGGGFMLWETLSDNAYTTSGTGNFAVASFGSFDPLTTGIILDAYTVGYQAIASCNIYLANIGRVPGLTIQERNRYIADVRFLRAYQYFMLSELYGGLPLITKPLANNDESKRISRVSKTIVVDTILADLEYAVNNLPNTAYSGRVTRGTALAYKAKVLMSNGKFTEAAAAAKTVIDEKLFSLNASYNSLFLKPGQNNNAEIMFSARYLPPAFYSPQDWLLSYVNFVQPLKYLVNDYECTDGLPISSSPLYNAAKPYENRDIRLASTVIVPGNLRGVSPGTEFDPARDNVPSGFLPRKGVDPNRFPTTYATISDQDWVLMRYAEVLLTYAECQNEVTGPDVNVYDAVNKIRKRVNMPDLPVGLTQTAMREKIRHERRVELALEGQRYFDLKRWGNIKSVITAVIDPNNKARTFPDRNLLWPIPQSEIDKAKALGNTGLTQNPGYF